MHCKSCLKESKYFSACMHPYCEKCYETQLLCTVCDHGKKESTLYSLFSYLNLGYIKNMFNQIIN